MFDESMENTENVCDFIIAEKNELTIKDSTEECCVKVLGQSLKNHRFKNYRDNKDRYFRLS
jgi:hypothetical protein